MRQSSLTDYKKKKRKRHAFDPHGNVNGYRRRIDHTVWEPIYYPLTFEDFRPFDILGVESKSEIGVGIRTASLVDGKPAFLNHVGQVILKDGKLVVSEANFPVHAYTPVEDYLRAQAEGKCRLTLMRIDTRVYGGDMPESKKMVAEAACLEYHLSLEGYKYTAGIFFPLAAFSILRNFTPLIRGRYYNLPVEDMFKIFICSNIVDLGWKTGQEITGKDWFLSSLHKYITTPQDIFEGPYTLFICGWTREPKQLNRERRINEDRKRTKVRYSPHGNRMGALLYGDYRGCSLPDGSRERPGYKTLYGYIDRLHILSAVDNRLLLPC